MNRSIESKLKEAVRYVGGGIAPTPLQKRKPKPSSIEKRLMEAKKAWKSR
jgi:hypothetical protein